MYVCERTRARLFVSVCGHNDCEEYYAILYMLFFVISISIAIKQQEIYLKKKVKEMRSMELITSSKRL